MSCKLKRNNKYTECDKPSNPALVKETDTKLKELLETRAKQDALLFSPIISNIQEKVVVKNVIQ